MKWLLVYTFISSAQINHEYNWYDSMFDCFDDRDKVIFLNGRPIINYQLQCIPVKERNYELIMEELLPSHWD